MMDLGDRYSGCTLTAAFTTVNTSGVPTSITGTAGNQSTGNCFLVVWKTAPAAGAWSCSSSGITQSFDCKGASGFNGFSVNTNADASFYSCGNDYLVILHGGLISTTCINYYTVASFSLKNRAGLNPTITGRQLDVSSGGEAGLDWANIGSPHTIQRFGCTSIFDVQSVCNAVTAVATVAFTEQGIACTVWNSLRSGYGTCGTFGYLLDCSTSSAVQPTVPGRRLDVSTGGAAGLDWANIEGSNASNFLSCTSMFSAQTVCNAVNAIPNYTEQGIACTVWNSLQSNYDVCGSFGVLLDSTISSRLAPTTAGRTLDVSTTGEAGIDWANIGSPQTAQRLGCTQLFSVQSTCNSVVADTVSDKTGYALSAAGVDAILDDAISEPSGVFSWSATPRTILQWTGAVLSNCVRQTATQQLVRNRADSTTLGTSEITCTATTMNRGSFT